MSSAYPFFVTTHSVRPKLSFGHSFPQSSCFAYEAGALLERSDVAERYAQQSAGNRIRIGSTVNGNLVYVSYWHLQAGNAIGTNPRTGQPFKKGDSVKAGNIIGYSGLTGNANQNNKPHLHLGIKNSQGSWVDPAPYLNATFQLSSMEMTTPCD